MTVIFLLSSAIVMSDKVAEDEIFCCELPGGRDGDALVAGSRERE